MGVLLGLASPNTPVPNSDQEVTIGSGFTMTRDFETGVDGESADDRNISGQQYLGFDGGADNSYFSNEHTAPGSSMAVSCTTVGGGSSGWGDWGGIWDETLNPPGFDRVYAGGSVHYRCKFYIPSSFDFGTHSGVVTTEGVKFCRIHSRNPNYPSDHPDDWDNEGYLTCFLHDNGDGGTRLGIGSEITNSTWVNNGQYHTTFTEHNFDSGKYSRYNLSPVLARDTWHTVEMQMKNSSVDGQGVVRLWLNRELLLEDLDLRTAHTPESFYDGYLMFTIWNEGAPKVQTLWVDSVIITSSTPSDTDDHGNPFIGTD